MLVKALNTRINSILHWFNKYKYFKKTYQGYFSAVAWLLLNSTRFYLKPKYVLILIIAKSSSAKLPKIARNSLASHKIFPGRNLSFTLFPLNNIGV